MFISDAFAQTAATGGASGQIMQILPLALIFLVFYFLLIRPQQRKAKQHKEMTANLRRGDKVVTGGGILAQVTKVEGTEVTVEIAEGVKVKLIADTISAVLTKPEPTSEKPEAKKPAAKSSAKSSSKAVEEPEADTPAKALKNVLSGKTDQE
ncbi:MAG: preprotein translocase subunit YajC [Alphaproteobacteria bacterium RIFOXYD12_FULL_60_8]|nr:MAG: preprotein translocase subunit YajC [Alphaproteobacteria bacterium RIFOXYD12_FULL_60_8]